MLPFKTKQITSKEVDNHEIRGLYQTAFPKDEQIPWADLMRLVEEMHLDLQHITMMIRLSALLLYIPESLSIGIGTSPYVKN